MMWPIGAPDIVSLVGGSLGNMDSALMSEIRVRMQALRRLPPVRIAEPCVGIGALRTLFLIGRVDFVSTNTMDVDRYLAKF